MKYKIIFIFAFIISLYSNPFSSYSDALKMNGSDSKEFIVENPIYDYTMGRALSLNDSVIDLYITNVFNVFPDEVDALSIEFSSIIKNAQLFEIQEEENPDNILDRGIDLWANDRVGRSDIVVTAYSDSTGAESASDTFNVAVENKSYQWFEGGGPYSFNADHCIGMSNGSWKAATHLSLGSESYILKEIEFGFALPEKVEWKIVEFNEVPIDTAVIGNYSDSLEVNPFGPAYQIIDASFSETVLTGDIALVISSEGNYMSMNPNGESANTWIWSESDGWVLANSYTSAYDGSWNAGIQLEKIDGSEEIDTLYVDFESGSFQVGGKFWDVMYNTADDGGLNGYDLRYPTSGTWDVSQQSQYVHSGGYSAQILYTCPDFNWLITNRIKLNYNDYFLKFWLWFENDAIYKTKFNVLINDGVTGWNNILAYDGTTPNNTYDSEVEISLADYVDKTIRIAFVTEENDGYSVALDNIRIWSQTVGIHDDFIPAVTELHQNYPNPFNPKTEIGFTLGQNSFAKLIVYNSNGEVVKVLNNCKLAKGTYSYEFDGRNFNSGLYFYQLEVDGVRSSRKMVLMK